MHTHILRTLGVLILIGWGGWSVSGQDINLAAQYFADGEFEKASVVYGQLLERDPRNDYVFGRYIECLVNLEQYDEAEKTIKKQLKKDPENSLLYLTYGNVFDKQGKATEANAQWQKAIDKIAPDHGSVSRVANQFVINSKYDLAIKAYERGSQLLREPNLFAINLGELYRRSGDTPKMIDSYLNAVENDPRQLNTIQFYFSRYLAPDDFATLQTNLYDRMQRSESPELVELLAWSFVQRKDFKNALRQFKALDQRLNEPGHRIIKLAADAADARDFETAIAGYDYVVQEKGQLNPYFYQAKLEGMKCRRRKITEALSYTQEELRVLQTEYNNFLNQYGSNRQTAPLAIDWAELEALYINDLPKAISILDNLVKVPGLERNLQAKAKINLADYYLMSGERWESTLLYSQVDKEFKEETLGQEARFKNAKLAYFNGDFQWAQAQFDVLKASTSKLISNDAIDLSVFIMDNLNLDTTADAITLYAGAELLLFQNRYDEAVARLDTLHRQFPDHSLQDDILYLKAQIAEKRRDYARALVFYQKVADNYPEDIRADNALFAMAQLYEIRFKDIEKAKTLYEKIFNDYSGSVFAVDARKRFRVLRGDKVQ
jgi:tetratricopeptide (TPR) repeat protein